MREVQQMVGDFLKDRPTMAANNTFPAVVELLLGEVAELQDAHLNGDNKDIAQEMADVMIFCLTLANILGVDAEAEVREKVAYNMTRYTAANFQQGTYEEGRNKSREWVKGNDWKHIFYGDIRMSQEQPENKLSPVSATIQLPDPGHPPQT